MPAAAQPWTPLEWLHVVLRLIVFILWTIAWYKHGKTKCPPNLEEARKTSQAFFIAWGVLWLVATIVGFVLVKQSNTSVLA
jgi:hypothetical protein